MQNTAVKRKWFAASWCFEGAQGGGLCITDEGIEFKTGKEQLPPVFRHFILYFPDIDLKNISIDRRTIRDISLARALEVFPAIVVHLHSGEKYKFIVFSRAKFLTLIRKIQPGLENPPG